MTELEATKNHQDADQDEADYRDDRIQEHTDLCPVTSFEKHLSGLNPKCDALFQKPVSAKSKSKWNFTANPIGKNTLGNLMSDISKAAGTSKRYTNHCVRASTITTLYRGGVTPSRICGVTKHTDERSLAHQLADPSAAEKRRVVMVAR